MKISRAAVAMVVLSLVALTAACGGTQTQTGTATPATNALTKQEEAFILKTGKVKTQVRNRWNDIVDILRKNGWNVANISSAEHDAIQRKLDAVADISNDAVIDSPSARFNKLMHLWDAYRSEIIDLDNAMGRLISYPTTATRKAYNRAIAAEEKARKAFEKEGRRLIKASLEPATN